MNIYKSLLGASCLALAVMPSCTDDIKFGDAFQTKAPGGTISLDSVFTNVDYTEGFLANIYVQQYYGLPYGSKDVAWSSNMYRGKLDAVTDCYQGYWNSTTVTATYYTGLLSSTNVGLIHYTDDRVWEATRLVYQFLEGVDQCVLIDKNLRERYKAEAKCVLASRYFDLFMCYGGLPILRNSFTGTEGTYQMPRATVEETVNFMVETLDEAIAVLPWAYNGNTDQTSSTLNRKRWSRAGAMALKAKILTYAASPLFNDAEGPYNGASQAEVQHLVWYGDYSAARWQRALEACQDFFRALDQNGYYGLEKAAGTSVDAYRLAYRKGYLQQVSHEPLHVTAVRDYDNWSNGYYNWSNWVNIGRNSYLPTHEYMEMFCWSDGSKFDWVADSTKIQSGPNKRGVITPGSLFYKYKTTGDLEKTPSRDPRLYENMVCNGMSTTLDWSSATVSGDEYELWHGGYHAGTTVKAQQMTSQYSSGYGVMKYHLGSAGADYMRKPLQWVVIGMSEMYLLYAECLAQTGDLAAAAKQVQVVRDRVGMKLTLADVFPEILNSKDAFIEQLLRERVCELGMSNARYHDMVRYKRTDWMTKPLHATLTKRMLLDAKGNLIENNVPYIGDEKNAGNRHPIYFRYEKLPVWGQNPEKGEYARYLWAFQPNDLIVKRWLLMPLPSNEILKGYGLVQNPGWE